MAARLHRRGIRHCLGAYAVTSVGTLGEVATAQRSGTKPCYLRRAIARSRADATVHLCTKARSKVDRGVTPPRSGDTREAADLFDELDREN
jgi:hypothetical protein